jgi:serine phosphatase RsbU (regulator of sigma subunit)
MDIALVSYDAASGTLEFAGANNPLWICRGTGGPIEEIKPDKRPIGYFKGKGLPFTLQQVKVSKGDTLYIFTDGFADQFGGDKGKKFKYRHLQEKLAELAALEPARQKEELDRIFTAWKGNLEQVDDVLIIGIRL